MIEIRGIVKRFSGRPVLRGVSLTVPTGTLYGLIGPGAAGKSVLLKITAGLLRADAGSVVVAGRDVGRLDESGLFELRRDMGMLFQNYALFDFMTVGENIAFPLRRLFSPPEEEVAEKVAERLARMNLPGFEDRAVRGLSGGQKKRVGVARATITQAATVLYDEPTAGLDPVTSQRIFDLLRAEQRARGSTVLMVSSDLDRLLTVTDRVGMLVDGHLVFEGTTEEARDAKDPRVRQFVHGLVEGPL